MVDSILNRLRSREALHQRFCLLDNKGMIETKQRLLWHRGFRALRNGEIGIGKVECAQDGGDIFSIDQRIKCAAGVGAGEQALGPSSEAQIQSTCSGEPCIASLFKAEAVRGEVCV